MFESKQALPKEESTVYPQRLFQCLGEPTRLSTMLLLRRRRELCVCELVAALGQAQPKVSRHLAQLRHCGLLLDERRGQWVYYRLHPSLPPWALAVLDAASAAEEDRLGAMVARLEAMSEDPARVAAGAPACG